MDAPSKMTARTVLQSNGKPRRLVLLQPPHFRKGQDAAPAVDRAALDAVRAIVDSQFDAREKGAALARR